MRDYLDLDDEIHYLTWKIAKARAEELRWSAGGDLANVKLEPGSKGSHVLDHIADYDQQLVECKAEQYDLLKLIETFQGYDAKILKMKYVDGLTLEQIADSGVVPYSVDTIKKKHAELHRRLDFIDDWEKGRNKFDSRLDYRDTGV